MRASVSKRENDRSSPKTPSRNRPRIVPASDTGCRSTSSTFSRRPPKNTVYHVWPLREIGPSTMTPTSLAIDRLATVSPLIKLISPHSAADFHDLPTNQSSPCTAPRPVRYCPLLHVRRVAELSQKPLHQNPNLRAGVLPDLPIDGYALLHALHQFLGQEAQLIIAQYLLGACVISQRVIERDLVVIHQRQPPGGVVGLLAVDGDLAVDGWADLGLLAVAVAGGVGLHELGGLDKHAARAAAMTHWAV